MSNPVASHSSRFRFAAFAIVLLLVSGLVIALFDEARAVEIQVGVPGTLSGTAQLTADIVIPNGETVPIASVRAIIETNPTGASTKSEADFPQLIAAQECEAPILGCPTPMPFTAAETVGTAITAISFDNIYLGLVQTGYTVDDLGITEAGYVAACTPCEFQEESGYGYTVDRGYGYAGGGYAALRTLNDAAFDGYGYQLGADDLILRFTVTVTTGVLGNGDFWFTFVADTGSGILGEVSSVATSFTVRQGGGGGGGGGGDDGGSDGGNAPISVTATAITPPTGATAAFQATVTASDGQVVTISIDSEFLGDITFVPDSDLSNAIVTVVHWPADNPPADVGAIPDGVTVAGFVSITVSSGGTTHTVTIAVTIPESAAGDPTKAVLLKWDGTTWAPKSKVALTQNTDGSWSGTGTSDCCSDYLVAFDEQEPTVAVAVPSGTLTGTQTFTATASDNVQVSKVEFFVGDEKVGEDTSSPYQATVNTALHDNGDKTIRAVATDFVGNTAESSATSSFDNEDDGTGPGGGNGGGGGNTALIILIILIVIAIIGAAGYYFYQQQKK